jgi:hypothetical protein
VIEPNCGRWLAARDGVAKQREDAQTKKVITMLDAAERFFMRCFIFYPVISAKPVDKSVHLFYIIVKCKI